MSFLRGTGPISEKKDFTCGLFLPSSGSELKESRAEGFSINCATVLGTPRLLTYKKDNSLEPCVCWLNLIGRPGQCAKTIQFSII